jgi:hypothetical protein
VLQVMRRTEHRNVLTQMNVRKATNFLTTVMIMPTVIIHRVHLTAPVKPITVETEWQTVHRTRK